MREYYSSLLYNKEKSDLDDMMMRRWHRLQKADGLKCSEGEFLTFLAHRDSVKGRRAHIFDKYRLQTRGLL